jgi:prepilin-type N-terminal cleavage/methylation domain-containing protein
MNKRGFTILELLVVLAVMGVMIGALGFSFVGVNQTNLGDAQRSLISLCQRARALAVSSSSESRIIVMADADDPNKYLRQVMLICQDKNNSNYWQRVEADFYLPDDMWFVSDGLMEDSQDKLSEAKCLWTGIEDDEPFKLSTKSINSGKSETKVLEETEDGLPYHYISCNSKGIFQSKSFPQMPRLVVAKGKLIPSSSGIISPAFTDPTAFAGLQIQPFGGFLTLEYQDFVYDQ